VSVRRPYLDCRRLNAVERSGNADEGSTRDSSHRGLAGAVSIHWSVVVGASEQQARNLMMGFGDEQPFRFLVHDRDREFSHTVDEVIRTECVTVIRRRR
jgi:hypothetical protein